MHDGKRGDRTKTGLIAGIVVAVLIAAAFIGWGLCKTAEYEREANNQAREYAAYTDKKIRKACLSLPPVYQKDCAAEARHEQRNNERNEYDLVAQRKSALWAYIMGAAAVIGMGLSVIGVFLVWTTFDATRKANVIANDALDGQLRPWVNFDAEFGSLQCVGGTLKIRAKTEFKNMGTSPALYLTYATALFNEPWPGERVFNYMPTLFEGDARKHHDRTLFPGEKWERGFPAELREAPTGAHPLMLVVAVRYRSPYSKTYRYTCKIYDLRDPEHRDGLIEFVDTPRYNGIAMRQRDRSGGLAT